MSKKPPRADRLAIVDDMTIYRAASQKELLLSVLEGCDQLELDLSAVHEIDTAGLQLLILLKREASARGKKLAFFGHSKEVQQVFDFLNLVGVFGDPMLISAHA